ncbi:hypothetical protein ACFU99_06255 [Streptomyces sp. NPDC057654]|uniref:hypothetical protein n=1 Tax=Streptomyces sp. NPDC057654 TaxID=3346196 RepID=UPI0036AE7385
MAAITGWITGFSASVADAVSGLWNDSMGRVNSPLGWEHRLATADASLVLSSCSC